MEPSNLLPYNFIELILCLDRKTNRLPFIHSYVWFSKNMLPPKTNTSNRPESMLIRAGAKS